MYKTIFRLLELQNRSQDKRSGNAEDIREHLVPSLHELHEFLEALLWVWKEINLHITFVYRYSIYAAGLMHEISGKKFLLICPFEIKEDRQ